ANTEPGSSAGTASATCTPLTSESRRITLRTEFRSGLKILMSACFRACASKNLKRRLRRAAPRKRRTNLYRAKRCEPLCANTSHQFRLKKSKACLRAPARPAAVLALVATPVARHHATAFGAHGSIGHYRRERQRLLRLGFGDAQDRRIACLGNGVLRPQELRAQPAEDVIHDRLRVGNLLIAGPSARLKPHVAELVDEKLERHAVLQRVADAGGEA